MKMKPLFKACAAVAALTLALVGCSSSNGGGQEGGATGDNTFISVIGADPVHFNPMLSTDDPIVQSVNGVYETLVDVDREGNIVPVLASEWVQSDDGTQFTLTLRDDVTWHDGEAFSAADVKYTLEELSPLNAFGADMAANIASIETPDDYTVEVTMAAPYGPFFQVLTNQFILPEHLFAGSDPVNNEANLAPVGTGPFAFESFQAGDAVIVKKNTDWWGGDVAVDQVVYKVMPDVNARTLALQSGDAHFIPSNFVDSSQLEVLTADERIESNEVPSYTNTLVLFLNTRAGQTAEYEVRKAIYTAIDRDAIAQNVFQGTASVAESVIPVQFPWAISGDSKLDELFAYDPEEAASILDAAGYPVGGDGSRFTVRLVTGGSFAPNKNSAEIIKSNLEAIDVAVDLQVLDSPVVESVMYEKFEFDLTIDFLTSQVDPAQGTPRVYIANPDNRQFANPTGMADAELDALFAKANSVTDRDERKAIWGEANTRFAEQLLHSLPLVNAYGVNLGRADIWKGLEGYTSTGNYDWSALTK